jgi:dTDP-4-dehydrorhamnose 3,5-epimerase
MNFVATPIEGLILVKPEIITDARGFFMRTFCKNDFAEINFNKEFVQFNHSFNKCKGTLRGLHFQKKPYTETKLIRCIQGKIYDVAVDLRRDSSTFLHWFGVELSEENMLSILIPDGFAHGFQTLENDSALIYHHTGYYTPSAECGINFDDPVLRVTWPLPPINVSERDSSFPLINKEFKREAL